MTYIFLTIVLSLHNLMNKEFSEALVTLQNSKLSEVPAFALEAVENAKGELKRLNEEIKRVTARSKEDEGSKSKEEKAF